jgi:flagellar basal-body rod protein FlgG
MIRGLYTSALGMITQMHKMDVTANNIANVNTTGYKRDSVVSRTFSEVLMRRVNEPQESTASATGAISATDTISANVGGLSQGVAVDDVYTDFAAGSFVNTASQLDMAIIGDGFFSVAVTGADGNQMEMYTRDGAFTLSPNGTLVTAEGFPVLGLGGEINLPAGSVSIQEDGSVYVNGIFADTLKMTNFEDSHFLRKQQNNLYTANTSAKTVAFQGEVREGALENSNVNPVLEMTSMIQLSRAYEANQRMITIHDSMMAHAVNDLAKRM